MLAFPPNAVTPTVMLAAIVAVASALLFDVLAIRQTFRLKTLGAKFKRLAALVLAHAFAGVHLQFDIRSPVLLVASAVFVSVFAVIAMLPASYFEKSWQPGNSPPIRPRASKGMPAKGLIIVTMWALIAAFAYVSMAHEIKMRLSADSFCPRIGTQLAERFQFWRDDDARILQANIAANGQPAVSWRIGSKDPFNEKQHMLPEYDRARNWSDPENLTAAKTLQIAYFCPALFNDRDDLDRYYTGFALLTGPGTILPSNSGLRFKDIRDGTSRTILLGECAGLQIVWTEPRDIDVSKQSMDINAPGPTPQQSNSVLSSFHPGGAFVAFADGSSDFLSEDIDPAVLKALTTAAAGDDSQPRP